MAINLTQVQSDLKTMPLPDLMKYANGSNPLTVPPWMALTEMNARKQAQATQQAMANTPSGTVASKLENEVDPTQAQGVKSLTTPKAGVNMTKAKAGMDMTQNQPTLAQLDPTLAAPPPTAPPPAALPPAAPVDASVTEAANQPQQVPTASHGGLADIPLKMFKQHNFAPGGIVAFSDTGPETVGEKAAKAQVNNNENPVLKEVPVPKESSTPIGRFFSNLFSNPANLKEYNEQQNKLANERAVAEKNAGYTGVQGLFRNQTDEELAARNKAIADSVTIPPATSSATPRELQNADNLSNPKMNVAVPVKPINSTNSEFTPSKNTASSKASTTVPTTPVESLDTRIANAKKGIADLFPKSDIPEYKEYTPEEQMANFKAGLAMNEQKNALAGISKDPYADYKTRLERLDAEHAKARENEGFERFRAFASGMVHADPTKGLGAGMAGGADSVSALKLQQAALHDAHEKAALESMKAMAEAKDSRARGDKTEADKYQSEKIAADKAKRDLAIQLEQNRVNQIKAANEAGQLVVQAENAKNQTAANAATAEYQKIMAKAALIQANKPSDFAQKAEMFTKNRPLFDRIYPESVKLIDEAYKTWLEASKFDPSIGTWQQWSSQKGIPTGQPSNSSLPPKVVKDGVTYILQPNGNYIKQ